MNCLPRRGKNLRKPERQKILKNKSLLIGVTGGVAAYKTIELVRRLKEEGAAVRVVMTAAARQFVTPLSFEVASSNKVATSLFDEPLSHIAFPASADLFLVAPATANIIGKFANGIADDLLSTCLLSFGGPVVIAPAMNWRMYENPAVQENLGRLLSRGVVQVGPGTGSLACGEEGAGRMAEVGDMLDALRHALSVKDLSGQEVVVTAGPTREYLDPVRFVSNRSSGKMGYALARAARYRGADVCLISGPSNLEPPPGVRVVRVETAKEMLDSVRHEVKANTTLLVMAAAVADYTPVERSAGKTGKEKELLLRLAATQDIVREITGRRQRPFVIGFAAETGSDISRAVEKMNRKKMDMIVFNDVTEPGAGFDVDTNRVVIIDKEGETQLELMDKDDVARKILDRYRRVGRKS